MSKSRWSLIFSICLVLTFVHSHRGMRPTQPAAEATKAPAAATAAPVADKVSPAGEFPIVKEPIASRSLSILGANINL